MQFHMRAEFQDSSYEDFKAAGIDTYADGEPVTALANARVRAEADLVERRKLDRVNTTFDWRGQVVFVKGR